MKAFNIDWAIDIEEVYELFDCMDNKQAAEKLGLPDEVELPAEITTGEDATEWLSAEYGYLINGYELDTDYQEATA